MGKNPPDRCAALTISAGVPSRGKTQAGNRGENARLVWTWQWWADLSSSCLAATGHPTEGKSSPSRREAVGLGWQQQWGTFCVPPGRLRVQSLQQVSAERPQRSQNTGPCSQRDTGEQGDPLSVKIPTSPQSFSLRNARGQRRELSTKDQGASWGEAPGNPSLLFLHIRQIPRTSNA